MSSDHSGQPLLLGLQRRVAVLLVPLAYRIHPAHKALLGHGRAYGLLDTTLRPEPSPRNYAIHPLQTHLWPSTALVAPHYKRAALVAEHKLLRTIVAMLRDQRPDINPDLYYDKLPVDRNAALRLRKLIEHGRLDSLRSGQQTTVALLRPHPIPTFGGGAVPARTPTGAHRGGLTIRRLVVVRGLPAELWDRGMREWCATSPTVFLGNHSLAAVAQAGSTSHRPSPL